MDLNYILNEALNKALIGKDRIKKINSNEIAAFVNKHLETINYNQCSVQLKGKGIKEFWQFKNSYLIDKQFNKDRFGLRKDLTDLELVDKYALYLKNNL